MARQSRVWIRCSAGLQDLRKSMQPRLRGRSGDIAVELRPAHASPFALHRSGGRSFEYQGEPAPGKYFQFQLHSEERCRTLSMDATTASFRHWPPLVAHFKREPWQEQSGFYRAATERCLSLVQIGNSSLIRHLFISASQRPRGFGSSSCHGRWLVAHRR